MKIHQPAVEGLGASVVAEEVGQAGGELEVVHVPRGRVGEGCDDLVGLPHVAELEEDVGVGPAGVFVVGVGGEGVGAGGEGGFYVGSEPEVVLFRGGLSVGGFAGGVGLAGSDGEAQGDYRERDCRGLQCA